MTCVLPNRRYFGSVADKVASEALAASHHVHSHQQAKETRSGLDATGSPRLSRRKNCEQIQGPASSQWKRVRELDAPLSTLLCHLVTLLSYHENFLLILQQYDLTTASEWSVVCERVCSRV